MIVCIVSVFAQIAPERLNLKIPFALGAALAGIGLMYIGKMLRPFEKVITNLKIYQIVLFAALAALAIMQGDKINMRTGAYSSDFILFWVNAVSASIIGLNIAKLTKRLFKDSFVNKYLQSIGRNSIVYVCLNQIIILLCRTGENRVLQAIHIESSLINAILLLILSLTGLFLISLLFEKTFFKNASWAFYKSVKRGHYKYFGRRKWIKLLY